MTDPLIAYPLLSFFVPATIAWLAAAPDIIAHYRMMIVVDVFMSSMGKCIDARDLARAEKLCAAVMAPGLPHEFNAFLVRMRKDGIDAALSKLPSQTHALRALRERGATRKGLRRMLVAVCWALSYWVVADRIRMALTRGQDFDYFLLLYMAIYTMPCMVNFSSGKRLDRYLAIAPHALSDLAHRIAAQKQHTP